MLVYDIYFERLSKKLNTVYTKKCFGFDNFQNKEDACHFILSQIKETDIITFGGSQTIKQLNILDKLKNYKNFIDRDDENTKKEAELKAFMSDVYLCSANAITKNGIIVEIDETGNRAAAITYGPKKVFIVVGKNKLTYDEHSAIKRAKNVAAAHNSITLEYENPCAVEMNCDEKCEIDKRICSFVLSIHKSCPEKRIHLIFINEELGY